MASRILLAALLASSALGRAIPDARHVATIETRELTFVSRSRQACASSWRLQISRLTSSLWQEYDTVDLQRREIAEILARQHGHGDDDDVSCLCFFFPISEEIEHISIMRVTVDGSNVVD